ncbi:MAG TPA: hypothetical protein VJ904_02485, partial [Tichowtungia sp.]|nr:hypothetical protein [Tichowtungia sp.]
NDDFIRRLRRLRKTERNIQPLEMPLYQLIVHRRISTQKSITGASLKANRQSAFWATNQF